jgi:SNF2 family DNA or RNA helicase
MRSGPDAGSCVAGTVLHVDHLLSATRPIALTREGRIFRLAFPFNTQIVDRVKALPFAKFDPETRSWTVEVCQQSVEALRDWFVTAGLTDVCVDELVPADEHLPDAGIATLRRGSLKRPYMVVMAQRSDTLFARLRALPGAQWEKQAGGMSYPTTAAAALSELVSRNILVDPDNLLTPAELTVQFDARTGTFAVAGDPRAGEAFNRYFPQRDVVAEWRAKGFDAAFSDPFAEEVYQGEIARHTELHPPGLKENLFPYQAQSVAVAVRRSGFAVWDQPGLGKTAQAIAWAFHLITNVGEASRCVIVTPGAVKTQFAREITRFTGHEDVVVIDGDKKRRTKLYEEARGARWVVLNYDLLHLDHKAITPLVAGQLLVADEAHRIKGRSSKRGIAMRQLATKASRRLALSGTPVENDPSEWYTIMNGFVVPGIFGSPLEFLGRYAYPGRFGGFEGARNLPELRDRSRAHYIRHLKSDVATQLPPLQVQNLVLDPDERLAAALKRAHRDAQEEIAQEARTRRSGSLLDGERAEELETGAAMTAVGMLRLMCSSPRLVWQSNAPSAVALCEAGLVPDEDGPKLDHLRLMAVEHQAAGERLVVFTSFRSMADLICERLSADGVRFVRFTGDTNTRNRDVAVREFTSPSTETSPGPTVFVATDAAAEGLNLGRQCSTLVNFDLSFKPSVMIQRANRIHRIDGDTTKRYRVINLTLARTLEEGIIALVGLKADLADAILGEAGTRKATTGRGARKVLEEALRDWQSTPVRPGS